MYAALALILVVLQAMPAAAGPECGDATRIVWQAPKAAGDIAAGWPLAVEDDFQWGDGNADLIVGDAGPELRIRFPKGSINPGNPHAPEGGAGFLDRFGSYDEGCLTYEIRFDDGFVFGEGGKLPGLFGGIHNSGCTEHRQSGFSSRYMFGRRGIGFLYPYFAERDTPCGGMMGAGAFRFDAGRWRRISQRLKLNTPGIADGEVEVWMDGVSAFSAVNVDIRAGAETRIEGLMMQTFFGGSDASRASPADQAVSFRDFRFATPESPRN